LPDTVPIKGNNLSVLIQSKEIHQKIFTYKNYKISSVSVMILPD